MKLKFAKKDSFSAEKLVRIDIYKTQHSTLGRELLQWQMDNEIYSEPGFALCAPNRFIHFFTEENAAKVIEWLKEHNIQQD